MKNHLFNSTFAFCLLAILTLGSARQEDENISPNYEVKLNVSLSEDFAGLVIFHYHDADGQLKTISLEDDTWNATFNVKGGYELFLEGEGTQSSGTIHMEASAITTNDGLKTYSDDKEFTIEGANLPFKYTISKKLD